MVVSLVDKAIVVTGAGRGLGRAYALAIGAAGGAVVVNDVVPAAAESTAAEVRSHGGSAIANAGSVGDWGFARELVATSVTEFGRLDSLVNNAAIARHSPPWDETEEDLRAVAEVNILGPQFVTRHAMRTMLDQRSGGSVLNVISGAHLGIQGMSSYGASKGAVASMTRNWALEGRPHRIRVNALAPLGQTPMAMADTREDPPTLPPPETIAPVVVALLSDELRSISGSLLRFDGRRLSVYGDTLDTVGSRRDGWAVADLVDALRHLAPG